MKFSLILTFLAIFHMASATVFYPITYNNLGCWADKSSRAIAIQEGKHSILDGSYSSRDNPIAKCAKVAYDSGYEVFSVQNGGQCATCSYARTTYRKWGDSSKCSSNGEGGPWANQVYEIASVGKVRLRHLGCWKDTSTRAIPTLERLEKVLGTDAYNTRKDAVKKCVDAAFARNYKIIAVQNGGWCAGAKDAALTYKKYGSSNSCRHGRGGPWANDVYELDYVYVKNFIP